ACLSSRAGRSRPRRGGASRRGPHDDPTASARRRGWARRSAERRLRGGAVDGFEGAQSALEVELRVGGGDAGCLGARALGGGVRGDPVTREERREQCQGGGIQAR